jgi:hypothetical protein
VKHLTALCILVILGISGSILLYGVVFHPEVVTQKEVVPQKQLAQCEVIEYTMSYSRNMTIIPITDVELREFPGMKTTLQPDSNSGEWINGYRRVKDFEADMNQYYSFVHSVCKGKTPAECFPHPPLFEYHGRYYQLSCLELYYHTTYEPTHV